jgi:hypothetical protein
MIDALITGYNDPGFSACVASRRGNREGSGASGDLFDARVSIADDFAL